MGTTTYTPKQVTYPLEVVAPIIETKSTWNGTWSADASLRLQSANTCAAGQDLGEAVFERKYGMLREPGEASETTHSPVPLDDYWVRVRDGVSGDTIFTGLIPSESREIFGTLETRDGPTPAGNQTYVAYDPMHQLRRIFVSESDWLYNGTVRRIAWTPNPNSRDKNKTLVGNRTADKYTADDPSGCYLFGGTSTWTRAQLIEYLLQRFVNLDSDGPTWTLNDGTGVLAQEDDQITFPPSATVADLIRMLIPVRFGLDWLVAPTDDGFEIQVFSLVDEAQTFGTYTLPANPNLVQWLVSNALDLHRTQIAKSTVHRFSKIRVLGKRAVVACSLRCNNAAQMSKGWSAELQAQYEGGTGNALDLTTDHDHARRQDKYRDVFQRFVAPSTFDPNAVNARPKIKPDGTVDFSNTSDAWQNQVRRTLNWLPLRTGIAYKNGPPTDQGTGELLPPSAWITDPETSRNVPVDTIGMSLGVLAQEWGVQIGANPNHLLALNHVPDTMDTSDDPKYDYSTLACTIALEMDQRLKLEYEVDSGGDGSVMEIEDDNAELWILAKNTIVGVDGAGTYEVTNQGYVLRNDIDRLGQIMAGAVARYRQSRGRAMIELEGWQKFQDLVGQILTVVDDGGDAEEMSAPITSVRWTGDVKTIITAGFAG